MPLCAIKHIPEKHCPLLTGPLRVKRCLLSRPFTCRGCSSTPCISAELIFLFLSYVSLFLVRMFGCKQADFVLGHYLCLFGQVTVQKRICWTKKHDQLYGFYWLLLDFYRKHEAVFPDTFWSLGRITLSPCRRIPLFFERVSHVEASEKSSKDEYLCSSIHSVCSLGILGPHHKLPLKQ